MENIDENLALIAKQCISKYKGQKINATNIKKIKENKLLILVFSNKPVGNTMLKLQYCKIN